MSIMEYFLQFVDCNSQPNGRSADSSGPTLYFISKFTTIQIPKKDVHNYSERLSRSVVGEFNRVHVLSQQSFTAPLVMVNLTSVSICMFTLMSCIISLDQCF